MSTSISEHDGAVEDVILHENPISGGQAVKYVPTKGRSDLIGVLLRCKCARKWRLKKHSVVVTKNVASPSCW